VSATNLTHDQKVQFEKSEADRSTPYIHPKTIEEFEKIYHHEYEQELDSCDEWIKWSREHGDDYGVNFHQGRRSALIFNDIKLCQLLRILKREPPNV